MAKEKVVAPCELFTEENKYCMCSYYENNLTGEDMANDIHGPCRRRRIKYADEDTVDLFGGDKCT